MEREADRGLELLRETGLAAILRGVPARAAEPLAQALFDGGVRVLEVTLNTEGAPAMIAHLRERFAGRLWVGAGTVVDAAGAETAAAAGAAFFVTPNFDPKVISYGRERGLPVMAGAFTPTEILAALRAGAAVVKIFPSSGVGPRYFQELRGPYGDMPLMAVGGVTVANAGAFLRAGAMALGVGSQLADRALLAAGDFGALRARAAQFADAVRRARTNAAAT